MLKTLQIQHVSIPRPRDGAATARAFYGVLLGLEEVPVPKSIQHLDLTWFRLGNTELHTFAEDPLDDPSGRHFCLVVDDLQHAWDRLVEAGYQPWDTSPFPAGLAFSAVIPSTIPSNLPRLREITWSWKLRRK